jgi:REP element-mobilizing transposase RayT
MEIEYNNLYTHLIFTTLKRVPVIPEKNRVRIEKYITGVINNHASKLYAIYANPEHVHFLISRDPGISEQRLATIVADSSEKFINENKLASANFRWQQKASAFSVSKSDVDKVCQYIMNQPEHHKRMTAKEEYDLFVQYYQDTLKKQ